MISTSTKISKHLYDSFSTKEILLARDVRGKSRTSEHLLNGFKENNREYE